MTILRKGHKHTLKRRGVMVTEVVESVTEVPIMEAVWADDPHTGGQVQVGEKQNGTAVHVHYRVEWPDGSITHGTASEERFHKRGSHGDL
jgi:hypothetical protein